MNTELVNTESLLLQEIQGQVWSQHFHQLINKKNLVLYLSKDTIFNIYCLFINIELMGNSTLSNASMKPIFIFPYFLHKAHYGFFHLETPDGTLKLQFRATLKMENTNKKHEQAKV